MKGWSDLQAACEGRQRPQNGLLGIIALKCTTEPTAQVLKQCAEEVLTFCTTTFASYFVSPCSSFASSFSFSYFVSSYPFSYLVSSYPSHFV